MLSPIQKPVVKALWPLGGDAKRGTLEVHDVVDSRRAFREGAVGTLVDDAAGPCSHRADNENTSRRSAR